MSAGLLLLQTLTNLSIVPAGVGLPAGWRLQRVQGVEAPTFRVLATRVLRIQATGGEAGQAGAAVYRLRAPIRPPPPTRSGVLTWRWRAETPLRAAALRQRATDDSPVRVIVTFADGRVLAYSWGNREGRGETFASWAGRNRMVVVLERAEDADGSWHVERRDPFADYRRLWNNAAKPIVSVGVSADTDALRVRTAAEVGDITWQGPAR